MNIHLISSPGYLEGNSDYLQSIAGLVHKNGDTLLLNWLEIASDPDKNGLDMLPIKGTKADLYIINGSKEDFNSPRFNAFVLRSSKPILFLSQEAIHNPFPTDINDILTLKLYTTLDELTRCVDAFLQQKTLEIQNQRLNLFIDKEIYDYLHKKSYELKKSKSEIVRNLLHRERDEKSLQNTLVAKNHAAKDVRFNLFIDSKTSTYLRSTSYKTGVSKSEIIRSLLSREMQKNK